MVSDFDKEAKDPPKMMVSEDSKQVKRLNPKKAEFIPKAIPVPTMVKPEEAMQTPGDRLEAFLSDQASLPLVKQDIKSVKLPSGNIFVENS